MSDAIEKNNKFNELKLQEWDKLVKQPLFKLNLSIIDSYNIVIIYYKLLNCFLLKIFNYN